MRLHSAAYYDLRSRRLADPRAFDERSANGGYRREPSDTDAKQPSSLAGDPRRSAHGCRRQEASRFRGRGELKSGAGAVSSPSCAAASLRPLFVLEGDRFIVRSDRLDGAFEARHPADLRLPQLPQGLPVGVAFFAPPGDRDRGYRSARALANRLDLHAAVGEAVDLELCRLQDAADEVRASEELPRGHAHELTEAVDREGLDALSKVRAQLQELVERDRVLGGHGADDLGLDPAPVVGVGDDRLKLGGQAVAYLGAQRLALRQVKEREEGGEDHPRLSCRMLLGRPAGVGDRDDDPHEPQKSVPDTVVALVT